MVRRRSAFPYPSATFEARRPHVIPLSNTPTGGVSLSELLAGEKRGVRLPDIRATSCTSEWQQVRRGDVYFAVTEADEDGHDYAHLAAERGAAAVVCERPVPVFDVPQCIVADSRALYGRFCQAIVGYPSRHMKVIGITGTHGKTTVARLLSSILRQAGGAVATLDSFGYWDGYEDRPALGSLSPPALASSLANMVVAGATHAVVEISSQELSRQVFAGVTLDAACITQIAPHHLNWHGSLENYREAKRKIFAYLSPDSLVVLNADDQHSMRMLSDLNFPALTFGLKNACEISANVVEQHVNEQTFVLSAGDDSVGVRTAIVGDHHVYNCLAAATMALAYGASLTAVARGLEGVDRLPGRMERVACGQPFAVIVDAADSPEALRSCLRAARQTTTGRVICVFGANQDHDVHELPAIGRVIGAMSDLAILTTGAAAEPGEHRSCMELRSGFADPRKARVIVDRCESIAAALREAEAGDTVVIAGMGECPYHPVSPQDELINDCEVAQWLLRGTATNAHQHRLAA
jgi:UDP-N-acetylmuramoyl-L-alanyl-D-glutamate--2,6-diaminopimelate ligase